MISKRALMAKAAGARDIARYAYAATARSASDRQAWQRRYKERAKMI